MYTYNESKEIKLQLELKMTPLEKAIAELPKVNSGLIDDNYKDEYRILEKQYKKLFVQFQNINSYIIKNFKKEVLEERRNKYSSYLKVAN